MQKKDLPDGELIQTFILELFPKNTLCLSQDHLTQIYLLIWIKLYAHWLIYRQGMALGHYLGVMIILLQWVVSI